MKSKECCGFHDNIGFESEACGFFFACCEECPTYKVAHTESVDQTIDKLAKNKAFKEYVHKTNREMIKHIKGGRE